MPCRYTVVIVGVGYTFTVNALGLFTTPPSRVVMSSRYEPVAALEGIETFPVIWVGLITLKSGVRVALAIGFVKLTLVLPAPCSKLVPVR